MEKEEDWSVLELDSFNVFMFSISKTFVFVQFYFFTWIQILKPILSNTAITKIRFPSVSFLLIQWSLRNEIKNVLKFVSFFRITFLNYALKLKKLILNITCKFCGGFLLLSYFFHRNNVYIVRWLWSSKVNTKNISWDLYLRNLYIVVQSSDIVNLRSRYNNKVWRNYQNRKK